MIVSPYLTAAQAIEYLQLGSSSALYRLIREHQLPCLRIGRRYRFDVREVDAWLRDHGSAIEMARVTRTNARAALQLARQQRPA